MRRFVLGLLVLAVVCLAAGPGDAAVVITLNPANQGISSFSYSVSGSTINIDEVWTGSGPGCLQIGGVSAYSSMTVIKTIHNNSGTAWTRLANEALDPAGDGDDSYDPLPYPAYVPSGWSTSNDYDGTTFAAAYLSSVWPSTYTDLYTNNRDFVDFYGATLADGATGTVEYQLYGLENGNDVLLMQRPNVDSAAVPEPASLVVWSLLAGVAGYVCWRRKQA